MRILPAKHIMRQRAVAEGHEHVPVNAGARPTIDLDIGLMYNYTNKVYVYAADHAANSGVRQHRQ